MKTNRPHVALLVETSKSFGRGLLRGIARYVRAHGHWSLYIDERAPKDPPPAWLRNWDGDGVIVRAATSRIAREVAGLGIPVVHTNRQFANSTAGVYPDSVAIAKLVVAYLLRRQFRNFAFVGVEGVEWSETRSNTFREGVEAAGYKCHVYSPSSRTKYFASWEWGQDDLAEWIAMLPKPVAIMAAHDLRCLCVLDACRRSDVAVPEQVAVIGVDNDEVLCELADPPLSSVAHQLDRIGYEACVMLDAMMSGAPPPDAPILIPPMGVITRQSTDVVVVDNPHVAAAMRLIREHACAGIGVDALSEKLGLSRRALERSFAKYFHSAPHDIIQHVRLERAKTLLIETDEKLEAIAARTGFSRAAYLNVVFKRHTGKTPGEFRDDARMSPSLTSESLAGSRALRAPNHQPEQTTSNGVGHRKQVAKSARKKAKRSRQR